MTVPTGTRQSYNEPIGTGGNREDLSDILWDVSPTDTPGITALGKNRATATNHEHLTDSLENPAANATVEGDDAAPVTVASRIRLSNYTQIMRKHSLVSGTQEKVLKGGGIKSEMAYQVGRRMKAIKRDAEHAVFGLEQAKAAGSASVARTLGSFVMYLGASGGAVGLPGNSWKGNTTGGGAPPTGDGTGTIAKGTARALTEPLFKEALSDLWVQSGGNENILALCGAYNRGVISNFTAASTRYVTTDDKKLVASIDVYDGDFHTVTVTPDRFSLAANVLLLDSEYAKVSDLRPIHSYDLAKTGDAYKKEIVWEFTLEMCNPRAHMNLADLTTAAT